MGHLKLLSDAISAKSITRILLFFALVLINLHKTHKSLKIHHKMPIEEEKEVTRKNMALSTAEKIGISTLIARQEGLSGSALQKRIDELKHLSEKELSEKLQTALNGQTRKADDESDWAHMDVSFSKKTEPAPVQPKTLPVSSGRETAQKVDTTEPLTDEEAKDLTISQIENNAQQAAATLMSQDDGFIGKTYNELKEYTKSQFSKSNVSKAIYVQNESAELLRRANANELTQQEYYDSLKNTLLDTYPNIENMDDEKKQTLKKCIDSLNPAQIKRLQNSILKLPNPQSKEYPDAIKKFNTLFRDESMTKITDTVTVEDKSKSVTKYVPNEPYKLKSSSGQKLMTFEQVFKYEQGIDYNRDNIEKFINTSTSFAFVSNAKYKLDTVHRLLDNEITLVDGNNQFSAEPKIREACDKRLNTAIYNALKELYGDDPANINQGLKSLTGNDIIEFRDGKLCHIEQPNSPFKFEGEIFDVSIAKKILKNADNNYMKILGEKTYEDYADEMADSYKNAYGKKNAANLADAYSADQKEIVRTVRDGVEMVGGAVMLGGMFICPPIAFGGGLISSFGGAGLEMADEASKKTPDSQRITELREELIQNGLLLGAGMGAGKSGLFAKEMLLAKNCPKLMAMAADIGTDATLSLFSDLALTGQINFEGEGRAQVLSLIAGHKGKIIAAVKKVKDIKPLKQTMNQNTGDNSLNFHHMSSLTKTLNEKGQSYEIITDANGNKLIKSVNSYTEIFGKKTNEKADYFVFDKNGNQISSASDLSHSAAQKKYQSFFKENVSSDKVNNSRNSGTLYCGIPVYKLLNNDGKINDKAKQLIEFFKNDASGLESTLDACKNNSTFNEELLDIALDLQKKSQSKKTHMSDSLYTDEIINLIQRPDGTIDRQALKAVEELIKDAEISNTDVSNILSGCMEYDNSYFNSGKNQNGVFNPQIFEKYKELKEIVPNSYGKSSQIAYTLQACHKYSNGYKSFGGKFDNQIYLAAKYVWEQGGKAHAITNIKGHMDANFRDGNGNFDVSKCIDYDANKINAYIKDNAVIENKNIINRKKLQENLRELKQKNPDKFKIIDLERQLEEKFINLDLIENNYNFNNYFCSLSNERVFLLPEYVKEFDKKNSNVNLNESLMKDYKPNDVYDIPAKFALAAKNKYEQTGNPYVIDKIPEIFKGLDINKVSKKLDIISSLARNGEEFSPRGTNYFKIDDKDFSMQYIGSGSINNVYRICDNEGNSLIFRLNIDNRGISHGVIGETAIQREALKAGVNNVPDFYFCSPFILEETYPYAGKWSCVEDINENTPINNGRLTWQSFLESYDLTFDKNSGACIGDYTIDLGGVSTKKRIKENEDKESALYDKYVRI